MSKIECAKDAIADAIENRQLAHQPPDKGLDYAMGLLYGIESEPEPMASYKSEIDRLTAENTNASIVYEMCSKCKSLYEAELKAEVVDLIERIKESHK